MLRENTQSDLDLRCAHMSDVAAHTDIGEKSKCWLLKFLKFILAIRVEKVVLVVVVVVNKDTRYISIDEIAVKI